MIVCTIVARNYLAQARVLADSYARHHAGRRLAVLVIDADVLDLDAEGEPFDLVRPSELPLEDGEFETMAAIYTPLELATAVKPSMLRFFVHRSDGPVLYLDPDIEIFSPLDRAGELAAAHGIVLVPHMRSPIPADGRRPTQADIAAAGVFNLGFIGVGPSAEPFLAWWDERLRRDCIVSIDEGLFVDQRLIDFVPGFFEHVVLRDPEYDVAYWNLHERDVEWTGERYEVDGRPLAFFHYSGFEPSKRNVLSKHQLDAPRILLRERPGVARLCEEYAERLLEARYEALIDEPYGLGTTAAGTPLDRRMRRCYREALLPVQAGASVEPPPNPFDPSEAKRFLEWLATPTHPGMPRISRYVELAWRERGDLRRAFPHVLGADAARFLAWMEHPGSRFDPPIPPELQPARRGQAVDSSGVNVVGYFYAELGVGEAARLVLSGVEAAGLPHAVVPWKRTVNRQAHPFDKVASEPVHGTNVICINADALPDFAEDVGEAFFAGRRSVGLWFWEVDEFPEQMVGAAGLLDEIWVASRHAAVAVATAVSRPVLIAPLPIVPPEPAPLERRDLGLPEGFLFLYTFDFRSVPERKNPLGTVEAFTRAFEPGEGPQLVLKTINGDRQPEAYERLAATVDGRPDIHLLDRYFSSGEQRALMPLADAYVSLHRSEGFGLTMAEAMALGKPVVATGYSGNLEFMSPWNSYLVPYELVPIGKGSEPYPETARWAEPDLDTAARILRRVYESPDEARERGERAREDVARFRSPEELGRFVEQRLAQMHPRPSPLRPRRRVLRRPALPQPRWPRGRARTVLRGIWWSLPASLRDWLRPRLFPETRTAASGDRSGTDAPAAAATSNGEDAGAEQVSRNGREAGSERARGRA